MTCTSGLCAVQRPRWLSPVYVSTSGFNPPRASGGYKDTSVRTAAPTVAGTDQPPQHPGASQPQSLHRAHRELRARTVSARLGHLESLGTFTSLLLFAPHHSLIVTSLQHLHGSCNNDCLPPAPVNVRLFPGCRISSDHEGGLRTGAGPELLSVLVGPGFGGTG